MFIKRAVSKLKANTITVLTTSQVQEAIKQSTSSNTTGPEN